MRLIGNIIWLILGGLITSVEYLLASLALMITIIGITILMGYMVIVRTMIIRRIFRWKIIVLLKNANFGSL